MKIDPKHPRALSLQNREKLVWGVKNGITSPAGLIAFGRGEAFDYLLSERTQPFAKKAIRAAAAYLLLAKKPILSINGNSAILCANEFIRIAKLLNCRIEVNLFHYSQSRVKKIESLLKSLDPERVLISKKEEKIILPEIASKRAIVMREGIGNSDCVLVPLEDGDRCQALVKMQKKVIAIDLNPLSRTAKYAQVTIVDNICRCLPLLFREIKDLKNKDKRFLKEIINSYDNNKIINEALRAICAKLDDTL
ncbi:hypothetical protein A3I51_03115 [Candidatus Gottesmanbacteria bacterium RIFCSPLOWO2_02_FULL_38_8]|uniref:Phosphopantothenate/pantothenate synthetase n=1 Tax=Candidatus Gottesmanbacteria bacterium RIFCSPLOWO2_02_FULL_38_8 TaxID=1798397 RepID=A0A1F6B4F0_9BACT|nr:MAG: hypothetical protein A3I51_03115 [Candidatus Gottesmanbacteria bacterium RIFCSPLOWO2_02_FULL_38_8]